MTQMLTLRLSSVEQRRVENGWENDDEAHKLLDLIYAEFTSDPMSTQCFDARIVERVRWCVARRIDFIKNRPFGF